MTRAIAIVLGALLVALSPGAGAHSLSRANVFVSEVAEGRYGIQVDLAVLDLALALPLDTNLDETVTWGEAAALQESLLRFGSRGIAMERGGRRCRLDAEGIATRKYAGQVYLTLRYQATCKGAGALRMSYDLFAKTDPDHRALVRIEDEDRQSLYLAGGNQGMIDLPMEMRAPGFKQFFLEGIRHLAIGYDHLAFLLALLLPAGLSRAGGQWRPAANFGSVLLDSVTIASCFTLAHSLTLALAVMEWVQPDSDWIETAIAGSIVVAALANLRPSWSIRGWALAFAFGLIHGFGFAGALSELGLGSDARAWSLLAFNLGVEAGQLVVVLILLPPIFLLSRTGSYIRFGLPLLSVGTAMAGFYWLVQRI